jgi:hypothetical protein
MALPRLSYNYLSAHRFGQKTGLESVNLECVSQLSTKPGEEPVWSVASTDITLSIAGSDYEAARTKPKCGALFISRCDIEHSNSVQQEARATFQTLGAL